MGAQLPDLASYGPRTTGGCPKRKTYLRSSVAASTAVRRPPPGPVAPLGPIEIIYFHKYNCGHCKRMEKALAAWALALPDEVAFTRHVVNDEPIGAPSASLDAYSLDRVPALVVNRKYKIELNSSDAPMVSRALSLAMDLAGEFRR